MKRLFCTITIILSGIVTYAQPTLTTGEGTDNSSSILVGIFFLVLLGVFTVFVYYMGFILWFRARLSGVKLNLYHLVIMRIKRVPIYLIVNAMIKGGEADIVIPAGKLISHYMSGGDISKVVEALITAKNADMELSEDDQLNLSFDVAANIDLANYDVMRAVHDSIHYRVLETEPIRAYAKDGVELTMKCKVTIRPQIRKIVGGISSATVLARVNEGLVSIIGRTETHYKVIEDPYKIANAVENMKELFSDTAYIVKSIDISDIEIGKDIRAEIAIERAEAEKKKAEAEQAKAVSKEQMMKALAQEAKVNLINAETEVQKAMAAAFLDGKLSVHEYHQMMNTEADTRMRESISKKDGGGH